MESISNGARFELERIGAKILREDAKRRIDNRLGEFADSVRAALIKFAHTNNKDLLDSSELRDLYVEADQIIADQIIADQHSE